MTIVSLTAPQTDKPQLATLQATIGLGAIDWRQDVRTIRSARIDFSRREKFYHSLDRFLPNVQIVVAVALPV